MGEIIGVHHKAFNAANPREWALLASSAAKLGDKASAKAIKHRLDQHMADPNHFDSDALNAVKKFAS